MISERMIAVFEENKKKVWENWGGNTVNMSIVN